MIRHILFAALCVAAPVVAQDFSEGSEARSWNLFAEMPAKFDARVVDVLCEFTGDCPEDCGGGDRQLGLLRVADDVLVLPLKNNQPIFTGAAVDLAPFCGQDVTVDGLMIEDPDLGAQSVYLLQTIAPAEGDEVAANRWLEVWMEAHPDAEGDGPWFRRDPAVQAELDAEGWFGFGPERDAEILKELYE